MKSKVPQAIIKTGREKSIYRRHPWVYSGAIREVNGNPIGGDTIDLVSEKGEFLARGAYSPISQIRIRIWSWNPAEQIETGYIKCVLQRAIDARKTEKSLIKTDAYRLVHGESDNFPGLVVDRYADTLVIQVLSYGAERWKDIIVQSLRELTGIKNIVERSDVDVRTLEGLEQTTDILSGDPHQEDIKIKENGLEYLVDIKRGQKTGFFLDQRQNRQIVRDLANGKEILDCFCYSGGFTVSGLAGGAIEVTAIDASEDAIARGKQHVGLNHFDQKCVKWIKGDVFVELRGLRDRAKQYDMVVLDPPKFAASVSQIEKAARGYKDINLLAMKLLKPGGILVTFSCSGSIKTDLFQKIVAGAALDAGIDAQIIKQLHQAEDHPILLSFPEGEYLKGLVLRINK